ncbi:MAG TPA: NUDIX hydrolase [Micromonosporaceae bacterium]
MDLPPIKRVRAPRWLAEHAEAFRASGTPPAVPRLAATVVLLRPAEAGIEVYVQRRAATMSFAPGMYAFPGGSVDRTDYPGDDRADAGPVGEWSLSGDSAQAVLRAAVRELAEETGVRLGTGALAAWARWLTPEFEPRRFDTFFFVARMPADQQPRGGGSESDHAAWLAPGEALGLPMLPPTRHTLGELAGYADVDAVLAAASGRDVSVPVRPVIEVDADGVWLRPG